MDFLHGKEKFIEEYLGTGPSRGYFARWSFVLVVIFLSLGFLSFRLYFLQPNGSLSYAVNLPSVGYTTADTLPPSQISLAKDGSGIVTFRFRIQDSGHRLVTLQNFEYSSDGGVTWQSPLHGDASFALFISRPGDGWSNNAGANYDTAPDFHGTVHSFQFQTRHADVVGFDNASQNTLKIRFRAKSDFGLSPYVVSEAFLLENL